MKAASSESFGYNEDPIVSSDVIGMKYGSLFDSTQTMVTEIGDGKYEVQVVSWYDNENSYTSQMVRSRVLPAVKSVVLKRHDKIPRLPVGGFFASNFSCLSFNAFGASLY